MLTRPETEDAARLAAARQRYFYTTGGSAAIMNPSHYNSTVIDLLQAEAIALGIAMQRGPIRYDMLVELGCYDGRYLNAADMLGVEYLGIDLDPTAIQTLQERLEISVTSASAIRTDILDYQSWLPLIKVHESLCLFTFNLLGNLHTPGCLLAQLADIGSSILISGFNTSEAATEARLDYYSAAGVGNLTAERTPDGSVVLNGDNGHFSSIALSEDAIENMLFIAGFGKVRFITTSVSTIAHGGS